MREDIKKAVEEAEQSEGFLIMVTRLSKDVLYHTYFTSTFKRDDIMLSLDEHAKLLEKEIGQIQTVTQTKEAKTEKVELPGETKEIPEKPVDIL